MIAMGQILTKQTNKMTEKLVTKTVFLDEISISAA